MKSFVISVGLLVILMAGGLRIFSNNWNPIASDGFGYYLYLPQILKYQNVTGEEMWSHFDKNDTLNAEGRLIELDNGNYLNKYPIGEAILMLPFFLLADVSNTVLFQQSNYFDGVYSFFMLVSVIFYLIVGIYFLSKSLLKFFNKKIAFLTLVVLILGTNLLHYATYDATFSHIYSFCILSIFTYLILSFEKLKNKNLYWVGLGLFYGLAVAIRQTNLIIGLLLFIPFLQLLKELKLIQVFRKYFFKFLIFTLIAALAFLPQMIYWYLVSSKLFVFSYLGESFNFLNLEILNVLFSARKGLFFWSPLLLLSIAGFVIGFKKKQKELVVMGSIVLIQLIVISGWWAWSYGYSFGHRAFTEFLVLFAFPLGFFVEWILSKKSRVLKIFAAVVISVLILLNLFQMQQYWRGLLNPDGMTIESYQKIFLQPCTSLIPALRCDWL